MVLHSVPTKSLNCHQDNRTGTVFDEAEETPLSVGHCVTTTILSNGSSPRLNDGPYNKANDGSPCVGNLTTTAYGNNYGNRGRTDIRFVSLIFLMHLIFCYFRKLYIFFYGVPQKIKTNWLDLRILFVLFARTKVSWTWFSLCYILSSSLFITYQSVINNITHRKIR